MCLVQLFFQTESAHNCISELGHLGLVQFKDLNPSAAAFQRRFVKEVKKCEEMERILRYLEKEMVKSNIVIAATKEKEMVPCARDVLELESTFEKLEQELREINRNHATLRQNLIELMDIDSLLRMTEDFFEERGAVKKDVFIIFVQGDHVREKIRKVCEGFRASLYSCPKTLYERKQMSNSVMTQMEDLRMILRRTEEYRAGVLTRAAEHVQEWGSKVKKMKAIYYTLNLCNIDITQKLIVAEIWCPVSDLAVVQNALIKGSEQSGSSVTPVLNRIQTQQTPPTFNRTNTFTEGFQAIIDAYGVGTYQEINPAPCTIVTFPFLFAVMFGDCGHGLVMTLFAVWVISQAESLRKWKNEVTDVVIGGRYIILLMGMFSIYTGLIYNDCFSKSFNIFGSSWCVRPMFHPHGPWQNETLHEYHHLQLNPSVPGVYSGDPYVFGIDPVSACKINIISFPGQFSILLFFIHHVILECVYNDLRVLLNLRHFAFLVASFRHFRKFQDIFLQFVPQLIFMLSLFGYLIFLILYKWCITLRSETAPRILLLFINMMLFDYQSEHVLLYGGQVWIHALLKAVLYSWLFIAEVLSVSDHDRCCNALQKGLQIFLVLTAVLMVPVLLLVKPFLIYRTRMKTRHQVSRATLSQEQ
ncbi:hypothetical protein cypCar_00037524 [Cyprinus carpio]|nr:hypothetical protein cypCar_00037524 [Cyprinus carpio]